MSNNRFSTILKSASEVTAQQTENNISETKQEIKKTANKEVVQKVNQLVNQPDVKITNETVLDEKPKSINNTTDQVNMQPMSQQIIQPVNNITNYSVNQLTNVQEQMKLKGAKIPLSLIDRMENMVFFESKKQNRKILDQEIFIQAFDQYLTKNGY
jgi:hypothetical protein